MTPGGTLRLARLMQAQGAVVAMTGDAVNDAAALKQADIGVAMGSGSEVTKQAGKMILVDDNFGTLVTAVRLGRVIYDKIVSYVRYQMSQLFSLVLLFLVASLFNINDGMPLTPIMVLFLNFFITIFPVIAILLDPCAGGHHVPAATRPEEDDRERRRRDLVVPVRRAAIFLTSLLPLLIWPEQASSTEPNAGHDGVRDRRVRVDLQWPP
ncbi:MAG: HAD-IC family P-type ATPase [Microbacterium sp.]